MTINYRADIDGLRAIAVTAVVFHHLSRSTVPGGYIGVDVFFVISGYLITLIISKELKSGNFSFIGFYERRVRRIFPALFAVLLFSMIVGYFIMMPSDSIYALRAVLGTLFFSSNLIFWKDMVHGYFSFRDAMLSPLLHTWSLGVEEQFYLFFPIMLMILFKYRRTHIVSILVVVGISSLLSAEFLVKSHSVAVFFLLPFRAWELLIGSLLALNIVPVSRSKILSEMVSIIGLIVILLTCFLYSDKTTFPGFAALAPVLGAAAIIYGGTNKRLSIVGRILQFKPLVYIGLISYSLYLWHWPLIVFTRYFMGGGSIDAYIPALLACSFSMAFLSYHFIEKPFRKINSSRRKLIFFYSAGLSLILATVSTFGLISHGFEDRFSPTVVEFEKTRNQPVPFQYCDDRVSNDLCKLGSNKPKATILLWGDSHILAWLPAINEIFDKRGYGIVFAGLSACAPLLDVINTSKPACLERSIYVKAYLVAHPEVKTVIMAAYWSTYFRDDGPLELNGDNGMVVAQKGLASTLDWLKSNGKQTILIGPVPVYDKNVPLALAIGIVTNREILHADSQQQKALHASFYKVVNAVEPSPFFTFLDPITWMCADTCTVEDGNVSLYRDSNHLSVAGALSFKNKLSNIEPIQ